MKPPIPSSEASRVEALRQYQLLDTGPEKVFDDITKLASFICQTPIALMTLVDSERQWFKSKLGLAVSQTPREQAFCAHTVFCGELFVVADAAIDVRFATNPLVTSDPQIRFYAGVPLLTPEGHGLGSLCVIDNVPRQLTVEQTDALGALARMIVVELELRRVSSDLAAAVTSIKTLSGMLPICAFCKGIRNDAGYWQEIETYIDTHTEAALTHGICPNCAQKHF